MAQEPNSSDTNQALGQTHKLSNGLTLAFPFCILSVIQAIIIGPYLAILVLLFLIPLGMYSPCIREVGTLGPKPALIGRRGAPMVGLGEDVWYHSFMICIVDCRFPTLTPRALQSASDRESIKGIYSVLDLYAEKALMISLPSTISAPELSDDSGQRTQALWVAWK